MSSGYKKHVHPAKSRVASRHRPNTKCHLLGIYFFLLQYSFSNAYVSWQPSLSLRSRLPPTHSGMLTGVAGIFLKSLPRHQLPVHVAFHARIRSLISAFSLFAAIFSCWKASVFDDILQPPCRFHARRLCGPLFVTFVSAAFYASQYTTHHYTTAIFCLHCGRWSEATIDFSRSVCV